VSEQMFRAVWFAYAKLLYLEGDMACPQCGPSPENTIWDGVTLAFNRKHLLPTLRPPTVLHEHAPSREKARYVWCQQLLPDKALRKLVRKVVTGPSLVLSGSQVLIRAVEVGPVGGEDEGEESNDDADREETTVSRRELAAQHRAKEDLFSRLQAIPLVCSKLAVVNMGLAEVFDQYFGLRTVTSVVVPGVYIRLFIQVRLIHITGLSTDCQGQISAEESVLQMTTHLALEKLGLFNEHPSEESASALIDIPVLYAILQYEQSVFHGFSKSVLAMCSWIHMRGSAVLKALTVHDLPVNDFHEESINWSKVFHFPISCQMLTPETTGRVDAAMECHKFDIAPNILDCPMMLGVKSGENVELNAPNFILSTASNDSQAESCVYGALIASVMASIASLVVKAAMMFSQL
jgi:hypothetical protein